MSDFSRQIADEAGFSHSTALRAQLASRMWPPIVGAHQDVIVSAFEDYWAGCLTLDQLRERVGFRSGADRFAQLFAGFIDTVC